MDKNCIIHTLANGMRAVYCQRHGNVAYCGVAVNAGSRDEGVDRGLAHFVEHTIFKGTSRRRAWHILNRMELVGGELNAYTSKEETLAVSKGEYAASHGTYCRPCAKLCVSRA